MPRRANPQRSQRQAPSQASKPLVSPFALRARSVQTIQQRHFHREIVSRFASLPRATIDCQQRISMNVQMQPRLSPWRKLRSIRVPRANASPGKIRNAASKALTAIHFVVVFTTWRYIDFCPHRKNIGNRVDSKFFASPTIMTVDRTHPAQSNLAARYPFGMRSKPASRGMIRG